MPQNKDRSFTDEELIERLKRGEVSLLGELYRRHGDRVYRILRHILRAGATKEDIEDLGQEVFLKIYRSAPRYEEMGKLEAWIIQIAVREAKSFRRKNKTRHRLFQLFKTERQTLGPDQTDTHETSNTDLRSIENALALLPESQRDIFVLAVGEGMKIKDIATTLQTTPNAVSVKLHRARTKLQNSLGLVD